MMNFRITCLSLFVPALFCVAFLPEIASASAPADNISDNPDEKAARELYEQTYKLQEKLQKLSATREMARAASEKMTKLFLWGAAGLLVLGIGLFVLKLLYNIFIAPMRQRAAYQRYLEIKTSPMEKLLERAESLALEEGRFQEAAALFEQAGALDKAAQCKERFNDKTGAAILWERSGHLDKAANIYISLGNHLEAARVLRKAGAFQQAAEHYKAAGEPEKAAECLEEGGFKVEAAGIYEEQGMLHRAAAIYEEAGDDAKAGELMARLAGTAEAPAPEMAGKAAALMEKAGQGEKAADFYAMAGEVVRAVELLVLSGNVKRAANIYSSCSTDLADELLSRIPYDSEQAPRFAQMFLIARDYKSAARAFEGLGRYHEAAELYTKCGDHYKAGEMFTLMGDRRSAAQAMERAGDFMAAAELYETEDDLMKAADCYEAAGAWFQAGKLAYQLNDDNKALPLLQKVEPSDPRYFEASLMVARLMLEKNLYDGAKRRLETITNDRECSNSTLEAHYLLAIASLGCNDEGSAIEALNCVVDRNVNYEDAWTLLQLIKTRGLAEACSFAGVQRPDSGELDFLAPATPNVSHRESMVVNVQEDFKFLHQLPLFKDLGLEELRSLWSITAEKEFDAGTVIIEEGGIGPGLFIIRSGRVAVERKDEKTSKYKDVTFLEQGDHFGEMSLLTELPVTARVKAENEVKVLYMPRHDLSGLLERNGTLALKLYRALTKALAARLKDTTDLLFSHLVAQEGCRVE